ncbi:DUF4402 domain-containing protein [Negadavirga shengliensis]|uniref:DUF4402 domain-containing protein n=1 Tax=Negadavirga shengliensis TaxID=1389218 RepID=A0ABV9SY09_9BACT
MKNLTKLSIAFLMVLGCGLSAQAQTGDPVEAEATATATIITPLTLTKTGDMNFGNITATAAGGTVELSPGAVRTANGVQLPATTGTVTAAAFDVSGAGDYAYIVTLPTTHTITETVGGTAEMTVDTFTSSLTNEEGTLDGTGADSFTVGATLSVGADQAAGEYTNATGFTVSVNYQ